MEFHVNDEFGYISFTFNYAPCKQTIAHSQQNTANDNTKTPPSSVRQPRLVMKRRYVSDSNRLPHEHVIEPPFMLMQCLLICEAAHFIEQ